MEAIDIIKAKKSWPQVKFFWRNVHIAGQYIGLECVARYDTGSKLFAKHTPKVAHLIPYNDLVNLSSDERSELRATVRAELRARLKDELRIANRKRFRIIRARRKTHEECQLN